MNCTKYSYLKLPCGAADLDFLNISYVCKFLSECVESLAVLILILHLCYNNFI